MKSIVQNIDASQVISALESVAPMTIMGANATNNCKQYLAKHTLTAIGIEASINGLEHDVRDPGLEQLVAAFKGLMPEAKRKVAVAYELLSNPANQTFINANEALTALSAMYDYAADKIIDDIVIAGALTKFSTNPTIAKLIAFAKAAKADRDRVVNALPPEVNAAAGTFTVMPLLTLSMLSDSDMLVNVDGHNFKLTKSGGFGYVPNGGLVNIAPEVSKLIQLLSLMTTGTELPNRITFNPSVQDAIKKAIGITSLQFSLSGESDFVIINDTAMSAPKAKSLFLEAKPTLQATMLMNNGSKEAITLVANAIDVLDRFRVSLLNDMQFYVIPAGELTTYVSKTNYGYLLAVKYKGSIVTARSYDSIYELLANEYIVASPMFTATISKIFFDSIKLEAQSTTIKVRLLDKLMTERNSYANLLDKISKELSDLSMLSDPNEDKVLQLNKLKSKVEASIATVNAEIDKLSK
jgi:hypothetical protein